MRGRLLNPFKAKVARLDTVGTAADPDAGGPLTSGYDPIFREPLPKVGGGNYRKEHDALLIPCQVEFDDIVDQLAQASAGQETTTKVRIIFHFEDLERMSLVDATTGQALLRLNDRLLSIHRFDDETLIQTVGLDANGYFCTEARPVSFGLSGGARNLLVCVYEARDNTVRQ
jgi:hypothetical protein